MLRGIGMCNRFEVEMGVQVVVVVLVVLVVVETQGAKRKTKAGKLPQFDYLLRSGDPKGKRV